MKQKTTEEKKKFKRRVKERRKKRSLYLLWKVFLLVKVDTLWSVSAASGCSQQYCLPDCFLFFIPTPLFSSLCSLANSDVIIDGCTISQSSTIEKPWIKAITKSISTPQQYHQNPTFFYHSVRPESINVMSCSPVSQVFSLVRMLLRES